MPRPRPQYAIQLNETQVAELTHVSLSYTAPFAEVQRARILLLAHIIPTGATLRLPRPSGVVWTW